MPTKSVMPRQRTRQTIIRKGRKLLKSNFTPSKLAVIGGVVLIAIVSAVVYLTSRAATVTPPKTLSWAPPALVNPIVWTPTASNRLLKAGVDQDVRIVMPSTPIDWNGGIEISGGRNVVLIGGAFNFSKDYAFQPPINRDEGISNRMIFITGNSAQTKPRTVHIEGVRGYGENIYEGINIDSKSEPGLTVQLQNIRIDHIKWVKFGGTGSHYGGDALQPWNGPTNLRVDRFTVARADYQAFFLQSGSNGTSPKGPRDFRYVNFRGVGTNNDGHTYLLTGDSTYTKSVKEFWIQPSSAQGSKPYIADYWKPLVTIGDPGDFVPATAAGIGYVSPGYGNAPAATPTPAPGTPVPTPAPTANPTTVKVMPLGDSTTLGTGGTVGGAYRYPLWKQLVGSEGYKIDFVGSGSAGPSAFTDPQHEGHSGYWIKDNSSDIYSRVDGWMSTYNPDIVLIHLGTNDIRFGTKAATATARMDALIAKLYTLKPTVKLVVSSLVSLEFTTDGYNGTNWQAYNASIPGLVSKYQSQGKKIWFADMAKAGITRADLADGVHPNDAGYNKMANGFATALKAAIAGAATTPAPTPAPGVTGDVNADGKVNVFDLSTLLTNWSKTSGAADLNKDGSVNVFDLSILLSHWTG